MLPDLRPMNARGELNYNTIQITRKDRNMRVGGVGGVDRTKGVDESHFRQSSGR